MLVRPYGDDGARGKGQPITEPARTVTSKARLGLVTENLADPVQVCLARIPPGAWMVCEPLP